MTCINYYINFVPIITRTFYIWTYRNYVGAKVFFSVFYLKRINDVENGFYIEVADTTKRQH